MATKDIIGGAGCDVNRRKISSRLRFRQKLKKCQKKEYFACCLHRILIQRQDGGRIVRVAISDSDKRFSQKVERILRKYEEQKKIHVELEVFADDKELCRRMKAGRQFDLVIRDDLWGWFDYVEFDDIDMEVRFRGRMSCYLPRILYVHFQENQALELPHQTSSGRMLRPIRRKRIFGLLDELKTTHDYYVFSYARERIQYQVPYSEILYFQSDGRKIAIHTVHSEEPREYTGKLSDILWGLPADFITIHKSYIVNIRYITRRSYEMVYIGQRRLWLSVSQNHRRQVREVLERYPIQRIPDDAAVEEALEGGMLLKKRNNT